MRIIRIDERLIHGQVLIGWIESLSIDNVILLYKNLSPNILDLYSNMINENIKFLSFNIGNKLKCNDIVFDNSIYIIKDLISLYNNDYLIDCINPSLINLGGIRSEDAEHILEFIQLTKDEINMLNEIHNKYNHIKINAQELPYSKDYNIISLIKNKL